MKPGEKYVVRFCPGLMTGAHYQLTHVAVHLCYDVGCTCRSPLDPLYDVDRCRYVGRFVEPGEIAEVINDCSEWVESHAPVRVRMFSDGAEGYITKAVLGEIVK